MDTQLKNKYNEYTWIHSSITNTMNIHEYTAQEQLTIHTYNY